MDNCGLTKPWVGLRVIIKGQLKELPFELRVPQTANFGQEVVS